MDLPKEKREKPFYRELSRFWDACEKHDFFTTDWMYNMYRWAPIPERVAWIYNKKYDEDNGEITLAPYDAVFIQSVFERDGENPNSQAVKDRAKEFRDCYTDDISNEIPDWATNAIILAHFHNKKQNVDIRDWFYYAVY